MQSNQENFVPVSNINQRVDRPNFHTEIRSQELFEGQPLHLETKLTPFNDPNLIVEFYFNGKLLNSSKFL